MEDKLKLKINVFSFFDSEGPARFPIYVSQKPYKREVDLLYWNEHYALIHNFSAFLHDLSLTRNKLYFCRSCFGHHKSKEALANHKNFCKILNWCNQIYILPEEGTRIHFKNVKFQQECPFAIYADFECRTTPIDEQTKKTRKYQHHEAISVAYKVVTRVKGMVQPSGVQMHTGLDCVKWLLDKLRGEEEKIMEKLSEYQKMDLSEKDKKDYENAKQCYLCQKEFVATDGKVRDHDHLSGAYR